MFQIRCAGCDAPGAAVCTTCRFALLGPRPQPGGHGVRAAVPFTGRARKVVLGLKYRNRRQVARHLAGSGRQRHRGQRRSPWTRRGHLGADQCGSPARRVGSTRANSSPGTSPDSWVCRVDGCCHGPALATPQTGRSRIERLHGPEFVARPGLAGRRVLVVDDVVTTGATLRAAATALRARRGRRARLYAVASTPAGAARQRARRPRTPAGRPALVA